MLKSIFVGPQGIRAGWRFLLFVLGGFALGRGLDWLTGGACGTEASAFVFLILTGLFLLFHRMYPPRASGEVRIQIPAD